MIVPTNAALIDILESLPIEKRKELLESLPDELVIAFHRNPFYLTARPSQLPPPGDWSIWLNMAGRGSGKTRSGAEWTISTARRNSNEYFMLVAPTAGDVRDVMIEGESGILNIAPPDFMPKYEPSKSRLTFPNGVVCQIRSADQPERMRGPQFSKFWFDELGAWRRAQKAWDNLMMGFRLEPNPQGIITTTPVPKSVIIKLVEDAKRGENGVVLTTDSTHANRRNLSPKFYTDIVSKYEGTRLGRQELYAELLTDVTGALWTRKMHDDNRVKIDPPARRHHDPEIDRIQVRYRNDPLADLQRRVHPDSINPLPDMKRIAVAVDPAVSTNEDSNETGIVVMGLGINQHLYVLDDISGCFTPSEWANRAVFAYHKWNADSIVAEVNQGGDLVVETIQHIDRNARIRKVHASRGKYVRAEPCAALSEQGRWHHVGAFSVLEDQMCVLTVDGYQGDGSCDHVDAAVWGGHELLVQKPEFDYAGGSTV